MLFDLQGRRKTAIRAIYLGLAVLMGVGLIGFGIGSGISGGGGLFDAITGSGGGSDAKKQVAIAQKAVYARPKDRKAYEDLISARYQYAASDTKFYSDKKGQFTPAGMAILKQLSSDWKSYIKIVKKPDLAVAGYAVQGYVGQNNMKEATKVQQLVAEQSPDSTNYLALFQLATQNNDSRLARLAAATALQLAPAAERIDVKNEIARVKRAQARRNQEIQKQISDQISQQKSQQPGGAAGGAPAGGAPAGGVGK